MKQPRYPVYVLSKGRADCCLTAQFLVKDKVDYTLVVEESERREYTKRFGVDRVVVLPPESTGRGAIPVRNWIWEDSIKKGHARHWILDDNMRRVRRRYKRKRIECNSAIAFRAVEDFTDRYENIAISGLAYTMFCPSGCPLPPFNRNVHVYSCMLINNEVDCRWRGKFNADTDLCLQVLSEGWCTVLFNAFMVDKVWTMTMKGGNTAIYQGDGRLEMARSLERVWPGVVETKRRFRRPQHVIKNAWRKFDTPLKRREDIDWDSIKPSEYGMKLKQVSETIKSEALQDLLRDANNS